MGYKVRHKARHNKNTLKTQALQKPKKYRDAVKRKSRHDMLRSATQSKTHQDPIKTQSSHHRIQSTTQGKPQSRRAQDTIKTQVRDAIKTVSTHKRIIISFRARNKAKHIQDTIKTQVKDTSQRHDQGIIGYEARKKKTPQDTI